MAPFEQPGTKMRTESFGTGFVSCAASAAPSATASDNEAMTFMMTLSRARAGCREPRVPPSELEAAGQDHVFQLELLPERLAERGDELDLIVADDERFVTRKIELEGHQRLLVIVSRCSG